jgi:hypothetical protein
VKIVTVNPELVSANLDMKKAIVQHGKSSEDGATLKHHGYNVLLLI